MHQEFERADELSREAIGAAIEVHRALGPGLIESVYEKCLLHELSLRRLHAIKQEQVKIEYKGVVFEESLQLTSLLRVACCLLLELKAVKEVAPIHRA